jgi:hypothetical protein
VKKEFFTEPRLELQPLCHPADSQPLIPTALHIHMYYLEIKV